MCCNPQPGLMHLCVCVCVRIPSGHKENGKKLFQHWQKCRVSVSPRILFRYFWNIKSWNQEQGESLKFVLYLVTDAFTILTGHNFFLLYTVLVCNLSLISKPVNKVCMRMGAALEESLCSLNSSLDDLLKTLNQHDGVKRAEVTCRWT